ncbi:GATA transcription factor [Fusarium coicis]|nr:GATA transcription factor [Fusarium coicis]
MTFSTIVSLNERTERFEANFKQEFKDIKSRLQALDNDRIELASVAGCKGSEWYGTEADFAMKRFLEYTESLCDSPPASFPGSPILHSSEACDELDTQHRSLDTASSRQLKDNNNAEPSNGKKYVGLFSEIENPQCIVYPFNPDLPKDKDMMPTWMEDLLLGPANTFVDSEPESPSNTQPGSKALDLPTDEDNDGDQPHTDKASCPKTPLNMSQDRGPNTDCI